METDEILQEQNKILKEILKWIKFSGMKDVKEVLLDTLTDETKKIIYYYSDGINNTTHIKDIANVSGNNVIPNLWNKWKNIGIIEKISVKGGERGKKIFNLEDFGIPTPKSKVEKTLEKDNASEKVEEKKEEFSEEINEDQSDEHSKDKEGVSENEQEI